MAALTLPSVSVEEYIARYVEGGEKPVCEYVDGELIEKPLAGKEHSRIQRKLLVYLSTEYGRKYEAFPELSSRLSSSRFLVPNIAVTAMDQPFEGNYPGPGNPVFLCVEIESPSDRLPKLWGKCVEYHSWGVPHCWVIDPERLLAWEYAPENYEPRPISDFLTAGEIQILLAAVFEGLPSVS